MQLSLNIELKKNKKLQSSLNIELKKNKKLSKENLNNLQIYAENSRLDHEVDQSEILDKIAYVYQKQLITIELDSYSITTIPINVNVNIGHGAVISPLSKNEVFIYVGYHNNR